MVGHIPQLQRESRTPIAMYWVPEDGRRRRERPKKKWQCTFNEDLKDMGVTWYGARRIAIVTVNDGDLSSCLVLSCLVLSCLVLSCLVLSCLVLFCVLLCRTA